MPSKEALGSSIHSLNNLNEDEYLKCQEAVASFDADLNTSVDWLVDETEKFCQEKAVYNAIMDSIKIIDKKDPKRTTGAIPEILSEALAVSFDTNIGHDFFADADKRYDFYHEKEDKLEFDLEMFNKITKGGLGKKTLNVIMASTGVGKTAIMGHFAAHHLMMGKNVLYITMEMAEKRIAERIEANLMNITIDELQELSNASYKRKIFNLQEKTRGKLIIKEYPTGSVGAAHFRHVLQELRIKKKFVPDVIYIDYLNICASSRVKMGANINTYSYVKAIAEEIRALAIEFNLPIISATQSNRGAYNASDMGSDDVSESWGLVATVDLFLALISTEELEERHTLMVKQLKNRYSDLAYHRRFLIGIDRSKMQFYDVDQEEGGEDTAVLDKSSFGERVTMDSFSGRKNFDELKF